MRGPHVGFAAANAKPVTEDAGAFLMQARHSCIRSIQVFDDAFGVPPGAHRLIGLVALGFAILGFM